VQWTHKLHSADVSGDPSDCPFDSFETIEFDPNTFLNRWALDKLDFAAVSREIKNADSECSCAGTPKPNLSGDSCSIRPSHGQFRCLSTHVAGSDQQRT